jgi:type IV secretory pathway TraG/TraD family ATPase VirD4
MEPELRDSRMPLAKEEYLAYLNNSSPNFRFGVIAGLLMRLSLFANPKIAALTEVTDFAIDELKEKLFTVYLATPVHRSDYAPLSAMIFNFCLSLVLRDLENFKHPLTIFADEFTNYGYLPDMPRYMTVIRNAGIGISLGIQDPVQLERVYKERDARILFGQPRTKIFFAPADDQVAFRISRMLGTTTIKESVNASGQLSDRELPRPLLDVFELMQLERASQYICSASTETLKLAPILSWNVYKEALGCRPPERPILKIESQHNQGQFDNDSSAIRNNSPKASGQNEANENTSNRPTEESYWDKLSRQAGAS